MRKIEKNLVKFISIGKQHKDGYRIISLHFLEKIIGSKFHGKYKALAIVKEDGVYIFMVKNFLLQQYKTKLTPPIMKVGVCWWKTKKTSFLLLNKNTLKLAGLLDKEVKLIDIQVDWNKFDYIIFKIQEVKGNASKKKEKELVTV